MAEGIDGGAILLPEPPPRWQRDARAVAAAHVAEPSVPISKVRLDEWRSLARDGERDFERDAEIERRLARAAQRPRDEPLDPDDDIPPSGTGLALSGGGIRSATFCVGALQAIAARAKLRRIDYLSTVSGGGYAGSWVSAWIRREGFAAFAEALAARPALAARVEDARRRFATEGSDWIGSWIRAEGAEPIEDALEGDDPALWRTLAPRLPVGRRLTGTIHAMGVARVEAALGNPDVEAPQVSWLRRYSNYLAPRVGLFSLDSLTLVATWLRNVTLNLLVLLAAGAVVLIAPRVIAQWEPAARLPVRWDFFAQFFALAGALALGAAWGARRRFKAAARVAAVLEQPALLGVAWLILAGWFAGLWLLGDAPVTRHGFAAIFWGTLFFAAIACALTAQAGSPLAASIVEKVGHPIAATVTFALLAAYFASLWLFGAPPEADPLSRRVYFAVLITLVVVLGAAWMGLARDSRLTDGLVYLLALAGAWSAAYGLMTLVRSAWVHGTWLFAPPPLGANPTLLTLAPPAMLIGFGVCGWLYVGLVGRAFFERSREWWSRLNASLMIAGTAWFAFFALAYYAPSLLEWLLSVGPGWLNALLGSTWLASALAVLTARQPRRRSDRNKGLIERALALLAAVFAAGLVLLIALAVARGLAAATAIERTPVAVGVELSRFDLTLSERGKSAHADVQVEERRAASLSDHVAARFADEALIAGRCLYIDGAWTPELLETAALRAAPCGDPPAAMRVAAISMTSVALAAALAAFVVLAWRVDVNKFSLHNMYKNRLIRCYLGASNARRRPATFTGFDERDDFALSDLALRTAAGRAAQRPFHIVNAAMNLAQGENLAWQERKAAAFAFSPLYCGFTYSRDLGDPFSPARLRAPDSHYRRTDLYAVDDPGREEPGFTLGMALSTSGAAVSPNMGRETQPIRAFLLTLFNARLGRWSPNPKTRMWQRASPRVGVTCLLQELFGYANGERDFVYLSDGGHFENAALYELVRRRMRLIVCVDAGADPERHFVDLGNAVHKCRVDFGVEIDIDLVGLRAPNTWRRAAAGVAVGTIVYPGSPDRGTLIVVKPTLCEDRAEPIDVLAYAERNPDFPQQTTADQFFNESQFESYRRLGLHLGLRALAEADARGLW